MGKTKSPSVVIRIVFVLIILAIGIGGFVRLKKMRKPPSRKPVKEAVIAVETIQVQPVDKQVILNGFGEIVAETRLTMAAEVNGRIMSLHRDFEAGALIPRGEVLLTLDDRDYVLDQRAATDRLNILEKDLQLAERELTRVSALYKKNKVGTLTTLEQAEKTVNSISNQIRQVKRERDLAMLQMERSVIRAPFDCRVADTMVEQGEYVGKGKQLVTIVDDSALEIHVALDSRETSSWLSIAGKGAVGKFNWFGKPEPVECRVTWTEDTGIRGKGRLDRIVRFDPETRTVVVAVKLEAAGKASFPLAEGMFCKVEIPGKKLQAVYILPRQSVTLGGKVYKVIENRLRSAEVKVAKREGEHAYIQEGLQPGDVVITTRLENPLEGVLVQSAVTGQEK